MSASYKTLTTTLKFLLKYERWTRKEFIEATGLIRATSERIITALHKQHLIHIGEWLDDTTGRETVAVFAMGEGADAKRRPALTGLQRHRAYETRKKRVAASVLTTTMTAWKQPTKESQ